MLGADAFALKMLPALTKRYAEPKQGAQCKTLPGYTRKSPLPNNISFLFFKL